MHEPHRPAPEALASVIAALRARFGADASTGDAIRAQHSHGEGLPSAGLPDVVVWPRTNEDVAFVLALCDAHRVPVVPFGAGSSLEGQLAALAGGVSLDMARFDRVLEINADSMDARVEAGVTREALNAALRGTGLFFPVDPGADATLGGMASTRASGTNAVRYGTMRDNVLGLAVVTPEGAILRLGSRARKSATGLDLAHLYVGAEGTLGVITELQVKLHPLPESVAAAVCAFPDLERAVGAVVAALQSGVKPARIELLDEMQMRASNLYSGLALAETPTLFLEFHGAPAVVAGEVATMQAIAAEHDGGDFAFADRPEERSRLWAARHASYQATFALQPGRAQMGTDACVPISNLPACLIETKRDVEATGLVVTIVGHVGDGNFHLGILYDPADADETARAEGLAFRVARRAIALGGTCSGEHGVGLHKIEHMRAEHGAAVEIMKRVKAALDPNGIMNPGKMYPP